MMIGEAALPARDCPLSIVTGVPGAGKSAAVAALLRLRRAYLVFDADWLLPDLSTLTGHAIAEAADLWPPYRRLWLTIARMIGQNGRRVVLFIPLEPGELAAVIPDDWRGAVRWCLLDCDDPTRRARLLARGWDAGAIDEAIHDGSALRQQIDHVIDTGRLTVEAVAGALDRWLGGQGGDDVEMIAAGTGAGADVL